ncbi:MAG TPA: hypothetical protein DCG12_14880, partial [Planctomycetaceae bacterium]|nr:hypothetical protein [Planctomycetaceae bacterium]
RFRQERKLRQKQPVQVELAVVRCLVLRVLTLQVFLQSCLVLVSVRPSLSEVLSGGPFLPGSHLLAVNCFFVDAKSVRNMVLHFYFI